MKLRRSRNSEPDRSGSGYFSPDYFTARSRFLSAAKRLGLAHHSLPIDAPSPNSEPLTINVAIAGDPQPTSALVVSSGVHGVEGFFGSAVQHAFLDGLSSAWCPPQRAAVILIHAINPFGFAWQRRFNEDNVDLNRNFLLANQQYIGAPALCDVFRRTLLSASARGRMGFSTARLAHLALRHGIRSFWETLPVGQYEFDDWLFFGGRAPSQTARLLDQFLPSLLGSCKEIVHLDIHTGLGRWGNCDLLLCEGGQPEKTAWWKNHFGQTNVKEAVRSARSYQIRGGFGSWLRSRFPQSHYRFATAEFGTYSPMRVLRALMDELHWYKKLGSAAPDHWSRRRLTETFVPRCQLWRASTLSTGLHLIHRAAHVLWQSTPSPRVLLAAS
jgi:hypothetical protein